MRIAYSHGVDLPASEDPTQGDGVVLRDERLALWDAAVLEVRFGHNRNVHIAQHLKKA